MNSRGFTLIEVLVATVLTTIILTALLGFFAQRTAQNAQQNARDGMLRAAQLSLQVLADDIRHSSSANSENRWADPNNPEGSYAWESDESTLVISRPVTDSSNNFIYNDPFTYIPYKDDIIFFLEDETLYRRTLAADTGVDGENSARTTCPAGTDGCPSDGELADNVSNLEFRYINDFNEDVGPSEARAVELYIELEDTVYRSDINVNYTTMGVFRN